MSQLPQQLLNGLIIGVIYSLSAVGISLIYGMMDIVNVAHGELYMLGALFTYLAIELCGLPYFAAVLLGILLVAVLGMLVERLTLRKIRNGPIVLTTLVTLGVSLILQNVTLMITSGVPRYIASPFSEDPIIFSQNLQIGPARLFAAVCAIFVIVATQLFLKKTIHGNAMRAAFDEKDASSLVGINVNTVYMLTYAIGAGLAALAGGLLGTISYVDPMMGAKSLTKSFAVVTIGGMGNFGGAIYGGILLGLVETLASAYISSAYKDMIGFIMVIIVLMISPKGLYALSKSSKERRV